MNYRTQRNNTLEAKLKLFAEISEIVQGKSMLGLTVRHGHESQMRAKVQEGYRHTLRNARGNLYLAVRRYLGMTRQQFAEHIGMSWQSLRYRERAKQLYHPNEIAVLFVASGMTPQQFTDLLNDIA